ncbi:MAG: hydrogenase [Candidatus Cloacimonetes bacterium]|jgi:Ni,Fe-hydrogenase III large subunit|nr:hydrogenase [Candidatus Cloacimonadota bacterium]
MKNPRLIPEPIPLELPDFFEDIRQLISDGHLLLNYFGSSEKLIYALLGKDQELKLLCAPFPTSGNYEALTPQYPAFNMYERLLYEEHGVRPEGHPWLKSVRNHLPEEEKHEDYPFLESDSPLLHEVGVGPVHAGVIEPGHFRFICKGERVKHLEIQLGYQHRGMEKLFLEGDIRHKSYLAECIAGDTAIGHNLAYCLALEALAESPGAAMTIRFIALEMERAAMHLADLSALGTDIAYIMGQNLFAALRTTVINSSLAICGSRFGKRWLTPGGVNYGINKTQAETLRNTLKDVRAQVINSAEAMFENSSVLSRFDDTGVLKSEDVIALGISGMAAKASGIASDARLEFPLPEQNSFDPFIINSGDVHARAFLRYREIIQSLDIVLALLFKLDFEAKTLHELGDFRANSIAISIVEGWRGRIVHMLKTDSEGEVLWYKILDPSFVNWQGLALAMRETAISDFPICNKSFNLSYCGSDL